MLVLQRPNGMGSSQPPEADRPFGYSFDSSTTQHDFLTFMEPPEPAPGQPLLSDNDNKLLGNFFESMEDNFTFEGLNFSEDWLNLPPQFMGHATSFGQQPSPALESPVHSLPGQFPDMLAPSASLMPPPPPPQSQPAAEQQASADVLAAATLLQNGSLARPSNNNGHETMYSGRAMPPSLGPPVGHLRHQPISEFRQEGRRMSQSQPSSEHDNTFTDMMFGSTSRPPVPRGPPIEVQWGSDASFSRHQSFVPQSAKETSEAMINQHLSYMECLEVSHSATNTRPSSPVLNGGGSPLKLKTRNPLVKQEDDIDAPPRKRRKSKAKDDEEDEDEPQSATTTSGSKAAARKRKPKSEAAIVESPTSNDPAGRRRKSTTNGSSKAPRENLSEEQKRENHIKSEQKRRTVIKEGFDDLCELVPGLKGGGFSKSTMLAMAAEWLEELIQGNEALQKQLDVLAGQ